MVKIHLARASAKASRASFLAGQFPGRRGSRGALVFDDRGGRWRWLCAYGGRALYGCTAADAPELDIVAFIPGKPYCVPDGATSFAGVCN